MISVPLGQVRLDPAPSAASRVRVRMLRLEFAKAFNDSLECVSSTVVIVPETIRWTVDRTVIAMGASEIVNGQVKVST